MFFYETNKILRICYHCSHKTNWPEKIDSELILSSVHISVVERQTVISSTNAACSDKFLKFDVKTSRGWLTCL